MLAESFFFSFQRKSLKNTHLYFTLALYFHNVFSCLLALYCSEFVSAGSFSNDHVLTERYLFPLISQLVHLNMLQLQHLYAHVFSKKKKKALEPVANKHFSHQMLAMLHRNTNAELCRIPLLKELALKYNTSSINIIAQKSKKQNRQEQIIFNQI